MNESITLTISQSDRAELEELLRLWRTEFDYAKDEHERTAVRIEENRRLANQYLAMAKANLEKPCGKP